MYFITCSGKTMASFRFDENFITNQLLGTERRNAWEIGHHDSYRQLSLFDDYHVAAPVRAEDKLSALTGAL